MIESVARRCTAYIESTAETGVHGRTGLVSVVIGVLFLLSMPFWPLVDIVPGQATAPALIIVGCMTMGVLSERDYVTPDGKVISTRGIDFSNIEEGLPVVATMVLMPLTYNITNDIRAGFVVWTAVKIFRGKLHEIHPMMFVISAAFVVYFIRTFLVVNVQIRDLQHHRLTFTEAQGSFTTNRWIGRRPI
ncbi:MAG: hypothetical protein WBW04_19135 [Nitrolancea sp.]